MKLTTAALATFFALTPCVWGQNLAAPRQSDEAPAGLRALGKDSVSTIVWVRVYRRARSNSPSPLSVHRNSPQPFVIW